MYTVSIVLYWKQGSIHGTMISMVSHHSNKVDHVCELCCAGQTQDRANSCANGGGDTCRDRAGAGHHNCACSGSLR